MNAATQQWVLMAALIVAGCAARQPVLPDNSAESGGISPVTETAANASLEASQEPGTGRDAQNRPENEEVIEVDPDIVCRYEKPTGTHMVERRCYTVADLAKIERDSQEAMRSKGKRGTVYVPLDKEDPRLKKKKTPN